MMILIAAAAVAAAQPGAAPVNPPAQDAPTMQMGQAGERGSRHGDMDCCKDCCKDMAKMHDGHDEHGGHKGR